jgi:hypothetical protein
VGDGDPGRRAAVVEQDGDFGDEPGEDGESGVRDARQGGPGQGGGSGREQEEVRGAGEAVWKLEKKGLREGTRQMRRELQQLPSRDPNDPSYRRLHYIATAMIGCWATPEPDGKPRTSRERSDGSWAIA